MADHLWKEKGYYLPLWNEIKITQREKRWSIGCFIEAAHILGYSDLLSRLTIEIGTINQKGSIKKLLYEVKKIVHYSNKWTLGF